jgi:type IV secretion system protein VirB9
LRTFSERNSAVSALSVLIKAKLRYTTLIVLPQNEKILDFVTGDKDFWVVEGTQNFCYIKPAKQGISTDVTLITAAGNVYSFLVKEVGESDEPDIKVFIEPKDQSIVQAMNAPPKFVPSSEVEGLRMQAALATAHADKDKEAFRADYRQQHFTDVMSFTSSMPTRLQTPTGK